MKKILIPLLLVVLGSMPAFSQMMEMPMMAHGGGHGQMLEMGGMDMMEGNMMCMEHARRLGLTDDQMMKMKPIHRDMQKKQIRFRADLKIAEMELAEIMEVKDFDLDKANTAAKKIEDIKTTQHLEMLKAMKEMRTILTDEQFKNMHKMCMRMDMKKHGKIMMKKPDMKKTNPGGKTDDNKDMKH